MARRRNTFAKRQKEIARKRKAQEKRERRWNKNKPAVDEELPLEQGLDSA